MKQIKVNPNNEQYYSKEFIRGFNLGAERQLEADKTDILTWIPCSERLPSEFSDDERVLVTTEVDGLGVIIMPIYDVKSWYLKGYITAWMQLPKPYINSSEKPNNSKERSSE